MKIVKWDRQAEITATVQSWLAQAEQQGWHDRAERLRALPDYPTAEEFSAAVPLDRVMPFSPPWCSECREPTPIYVDLLDGDVTLCPSCVRGMAAMLETVE